MANYVGMRASGGPLLDTGLHLKRGLNVLYGLNGAGKTRLLEALDSALAENDSVKAVLFSQSEQSEPPSVSSVSSTPKPGAEAENVVVPGYAELAEAVQEEALRTSFWALEVGPFGGNGHIVPAVSGSAQGPALQLAALENKIIRYTRALALGEAMTVDSLGAQLGLPIQLELGQALALCRGLLLRKGLTAPEALLLDLPEDGLPLAFSRSFGAERGVEGPGHLRYLRSTVITNLQPLDLNTATAHALSIGMGATSMYVGGGRWLEPDDFLSELEDDLMRKIEGLVNDENLTDRVDLILEYSRLLEGSTGFVMAWLSQVERVANDLMQHLLIDPPVLKVLFSADPMDLISGDAFAWTASDQLPLDSLSRAEKNWAAICIRLALEATYTYSAEAPTHIPQADALGLDWNTFLILDEPEAALHRTAEAHMAQGLADIRHPWRLLRRCCHAQPPSARHTVRVRPACVPQGRSCRATGRHS